MFLLKSLFLKNLLIISLITYTLAVTNNQELLTAIACEGGNLNVQCPEGTIINIIYASYGRSSRNLCPHASIRTVNCYSRNSIDVLTKECHMQRSCIVPATNQIFGDPCINTYKYVEVQYECVPYQSVFACEGDTVNIQCSKRNEVIHLVNANYGRTTNTLCGHPSIHTTSCYSADSAKIISNKCHSQKSCSIHASNLVFGDPCINTYKYVEVYYICEEAPKYEYSSVYACEGSVLSLACPAGEIIKLVSGYYGRQSTTVCTHPKMADLNCVATNSFEVLSKICHDKQSCSVQSNNHVFGDPCIGTYKYTEIAYKCEKV